MTKKLLQVDIVSAEAFLFSDSVESLTANGELGELGIAHGHAQLLTSLRPGPVRLQLPSGEAELFYIAGGILEVQPHKVTILADTAVRADDLDEAAVVRAKQAAKVALENRSSDVDYSHALAELAQVSAQLETIKQLRKKYRIKN